MCGIAGIVTNELNKNYSNLLVKMTNKLSHRGPDADGYWTDRKVYFGHRRLSILDLSDNGSQPMVSKTSRYIITFNGEIYNHLELRKFLINKKEWRGNSDTETVLEMIENYGVRESLSFFEGMFAIAIYDKKKNIIYLSRDRAGEKPLYYGFFNENLFFSSEINSFEEIDFLKLEVCNESVNYYFKYNYIPSPLTIYKNIFKLKPNTIIEIPLSGNLDIKSTRVTKYNFNEKNSFKNLEDAIESSVIKQMISDVPIGCFLSGGIDSSLIASLMQKNSTNNINTFTIGFKDQYFDESKYAKKIAKELGTNHHEYMLSKKELLNSFEEVTSVYDEPFADNSQLPTMLLCRESSKSVKVCLTGDGGDELFCGYSRYFLTQNLEKIFKIPFGIRIIISKVIIKIGKKKFEKILKVIGPINKKLINPSDKIIKFAQRVLTSKNKFEFYEKMISFENEKVLKDDIAIKISLVSELIEFFRNNSLATDVKNFMNFDYSSYLPDDLLVKVDRAAMFSSLETRCPFLDPYVVNLSKNIDNKDLFFRGSGKLFLKNFLKKYIDPNLFERPKQGFGIPIGEYIKNDLKSWADKYLSQEYCSRYGYVNYDYINKFKNHNKQNPDFSNQLWQVIVFHRWLETRGL